ncbi:SUMF1/EgtB/PvdO family nonheme iron enzyme [Phycisphaeraceae bacterium D3-23]
MPGLPRAIVTALLLAALLLPGCGESQPAPEPAAPTDAGDTDQAQADIAEPNTQEATPAAGITETDVSAPAEPEPVADPLADAPERFTDHSPQYVHRDNVHGEAEAVQTDPVPFDMIHIPGDEAQGIVPFYMGETEVTWAMLESWMYCRDLTDIEEIHRLMDAGLRPSPIYGDMGVAFRVWEDEPLPAVPLTRTTAEAFCLWLSEKTGRTYRLPTPDEFALALRLGGGCPDKPEQLLSLGGFKENSAFEDEFFGPLDPGDPMAELMVRTVAVKSHAPNAMGLYDLLGNAGEWVAVPGGEAYLMGGHFAVPAAEMSGDWTDVEDHDIWNMAYPQRPYSRYWYWGQHFFQGFRLVCEAE